MEVKLLDTQVTKKLKVRFNILNTVWPLFLFSPLSTLTTSGDLNYNLKGRSSETTNADSLSVDNEKPQAGLRSTRVSSVCNKNPMKKQPNPNKPMS